MSEAAFKKVTVNLSNDNLETAKRIASDIGSTVTAVINNAIQMESFVQKAKANGEKILIEDADGKLRQVIIR
jgi:methyltransferase-like protein